MDAERSHEPGDADSAREHAADATAPVIPDELIKGDWRRSLVLPDQDGQLRLTPVKPVQRGRGGPSTQIRYLDEKQRHSA